MRASQSKRSTSASRRILATPPEKTTTHTSQSPLILAALDSQCMRSAWSMVAENVNVCVAEVVQAFPTCRL